MKLAKLLLLAISVVWAGQIAFAQADPSSARVRVVHGSTDAPAVDVYVNGGKVFENLPFGQHTDYTPLPPGTYNIDVNVAGTSTTVMSETYSLSAVDYTIIAIGRVDNGTLHLRAMGDDLFNPGPGNAKVRVLHAASTAPAVDVYFTAPYLALEGQTPVLSGVPFIGFSNHLTVPAGLYHARVAVAGTKTVAIDSGAFRLKESEIRTVVALDPATEGGAFQLLVLEDKN